jgi:hypothetical protein
MRLPDELVDAIDVLGVRFSFEEALSRSSYEAVAQGVDEVKLHARANYRELALKYHPDRSPTKAYSECMMTLINKAWSTLASFDVEQPICATVLIRAVWAQADQLCGEKERAA